MWLVWAGSAPQHALYTRSKADSVRGAMQVLQLVLKTIKMLPLVEVSSVWFSIMCSNVYVFKRK